MVTAGGLAEALRTLTDEEGDELPQLLSRLTDNMRRMADGTPYYLIGASGTLTMDDLGDRALTRIGRWTVDRAAGTFRECGAGMSYDAGLNSGVPSWCNLLCEEPAGDDDDDSAGDDCDPE